MQEAEDYAETKYDLFEGREIQEREQANGDAVVEAVSSGWEQKPGRFRIRGNGTHRKHLDVRKPRTREASYQLPLEGVARGIERGRTVLSSVGDYGADEGEGDSRSLRLEGRHQHLTSRVTHARSLRSRTYLLLRRSRRGAAKLATALTNSG